jgi:RNAse (barnase) inhibitor barstar
LAHGSRSHNVKQHYLYKQIPQEIIYRIYELLDDLWDLTGFIPMPIPVVVAQFKEYSLTATHVLLVILAWRESRMKEFIYGMKMSH